MRFAEKADGKCELFERVERIFLLRRTLGTLDNLKTISDTEIYTFEVRKIATNALTLFFSLRNIVNPLNLLS